MKVYLIFSVILLILAGCCEPAVKYYPRPIYLQITDTQIKIDELEKKLLAFEQTTGVEIEESGNKYLILKEYFDIFNHIVQYKNKYIYELETLIKKNNEAAIKGEYDGRKQ